MPSASAYAPKTSRSTLSEMPGIHQVRKPNAIAAMPRRSSTHQLRERIGARCCSMTFIAYPLWPITSSMMHRDPRKRIAPMRKLCLTLLFAVAAPAALAQPYPTKPVRIVVPFAPGGGVDMTARILAQRLTEGLKQPFVVENRTGASGIIGTEAVVKSAPDGYTLLAGSQTTQAVVPAIYKDQVRYDTTRRLRPAAENA